MRNWTVIHPWLVILGLLTVTTADHDRVAIFTRGLSAATVIVAAGVIHLMTIAIAMTVRFVYWTVLIHPWLVILGLLIVTTAYHYQVYIFIRDLSAAIVEEWILTYLNYFVIVAAGAILLIIAVAMTILIVCCVCVRIRSRCRKYKVTCKEDLLSDMKMKEVEAKFSKGKHRGKKQEKEETESGAEPETEMVSESTAWEIEDQDEYSRGVRHFLHKHPQYMVRGALKPLDLGSRMQKYWYKIESAGDSPQEKLLTIAPVSQNCPLVIHKRQKDLNKLIEAVRVHPYLHPIEIVDYLVDHQLLVMVQPLVHSGSLKDMIYRTMPLTDWSQKYARRSKGLTKEKIAKYGRHILEALKFLYDKNFPQLGHVQTGNIFIDDDVCHLGGYENTLLGDRTRLFRLCKDHLQHFDVILFGHTVFEMAAGYELTHLRPGQSDYKAVDKKVRPVLEFIFEEGFPHSISEISLHDFFGASLTELSDFEPDEVKISDPAIEVLNDVHKAKPRVQKAPKPLKPSTPASECKGVFHFFSSIKSPKFKSSTSKSSKKKEEEQMELKGLLHGEEK